MASGIDKSYDKNRWLLEWITSKKPVKDKLIHMRQCLIQGADVNTTNEDGNTPLHLTAHKNGRILSELLLKHGANINAQNIFGNTPLHNAVFSRDTSTVELLLNKGADVNAQLPNDDASLHIAAKYGMTDIVEMLLKKDADVNALTTSEYTPLHLATLKNETVILKLLLNKGSDVNARTKDWNTPLHMAARSGVLSIVELLLNNEADVNAHTTNGYTPLHEAVHSGALSVVELLLNKGADVNAQTTDGKTPLYESVRLKEISTSIMELLLKEGANVNAKTADGSTSLHEAARTGKTLMVNLLLKSGADVNAPTTYGQTPLHAAAHFKELSIVDLLLSKGANVNVQDVHGYTPLHVAASHRKVTTTMLLLKEKNVKHITFKEKPRIWSVEELLLNEGANVNAVAINGDTPLYLAALIEDTFIVELLLKWGARVNQQNKHDITPLHAAVNSGEISKVELLLNKGANVNAQTTTADTPLHLAVRKENTAIATLLVKHGANVMRKDKKGNKPLCYTMLQSHKCDDKIVSLLQSAEQKARDNHLLKNYQSYPLNIFQRCDQRIKVDHSLNNDQVKYSKTSDTSGLLGQLYEINMLSLVYIRALNNEQIEHDVVLAANIDGIGDMDDICLRYQVGGQQKPVVLFIQIKHREHTEKGKLTNKALWTDFGDVSLRKYIESYRMIREQFKIRNKNPMFEGEFSNIDCYFILYTSAKESINKKKTKNKQNKIVHNLINTTENTEPFQYRYDEVDLQRLSAVEDRNLNSNKCYDIAEAKHFFDSLWFYTSQAKQDEVELIVKHEINKYYNNKKCANNFKFDIHSNAIFSKVHHDIQKWWKMKDKAPYLRWNDFHTNPCDHSRATRV